MLARSYFAGGAQSFLRRERGTLYALPTKRPDPGDCHGIEPPTRDRAVPARLWKSTVSREAHYTDVLRLGVAPREAQPGAQLWMLTQASALRRIAFGLRDIGATWSLAQWRFLRRNRFEIARDFPA